ncbi:hypothetical protein HI914_04380 [Erysiphe necator]|nr:hypothetical protein HI914_04380 [Erysiphe necator]
MIRKGVFSWSKLIYFNFKNYASGTVQLAVIIDLQITFERTNSHRFSLNNDSKELSLVFLPSTSHVILERVKNI